MGFFIGGGNPSSNQFTIGELMNVDQNRQKKANECKGELLKIFHEVQKEGIINKLKSSFLGQNSINTYYLILKFKVTSDTGGIHRVYVRLNPDFNLSSYLNNKVKIYCDCDDFKYRSAYTLNRRDSIFLPSLIKTKLGPSLTEPPKKQYTTLLCKHAFAVLNWIVQNYQDVMRNY